MLRARVLVVDDEASLREVLRLLLEPEGYVVETTGDARQALEWLQRATYDCVLLDLRMPGMDGLTFFKTVKLRNPQLARRIIFCTGEIFEGHLRWCLEGTGNRILLKPFRASHLLEVCREVCGHRSATVEVSRARIGSLGDAESQGEHHGQGK